MNSKRAKTVIIAGCGRLGAGIAWALSYQGYNVSVIDIDTMAFKKLPDGFSGYELTGDATDTDTLEKIGIQETYMLLALTDSDNTNSLIAQIASRVFNVPNVYMRLNDHEKAEIVKGFNIEVIEPLKLCIQEFERLSNLKISGVKR